MQLNAKLSGGGLDADAQGSVELSEPKSSEPRSFDPKVSVNLRVRNANLAPLFGIGAAEKSAQNINLSTRLILSGNRLTFDDLDSTAAGSRLRGHLALTLDPEKTIDGEVGLDTLELAPALAERTVRQVYQDVDESALIEEWIRRKYRNAVREGLFQEDKEMASAYRRLLHAGFRTGEIVRVLKRFARNPDLLDTFEPPDEPAGPE